MLFYKLMINFTPSIDDPDRDAVTIRNNFMHELGEKDRDANRNAQSNIFTIEEIHNRCLGAFSVNLVREHVRGYSMEEEPELEFVGNIDEDRIRLTDRGRNIFEGLQMNSPD